MRELFPVKQVAGFAGSLVLTAVALAVYFFDMSFPVALTVLVVTAFIQAGLQLILFMHAGETDDRGSIYVNIHYGFVVALVTVFGTLLCMIWGYM